VLTLAGAEPAARTGASILAAAGLPELIARSTAEYEAIALRLAAGPRPTVDHAAPLFDSTRLARNLERGYRAMWERWDRGESPADLEP
jgi:predicted O-linked N-acetylglucosamine transferase (SPINDLY family)